MRLKTPAFWYQTKGCTALLIMLTLLPFSLLYAIGQKIHQSLPQRAYTSSLPVICVGNLVAGGSGKTPVAQALMHVITEETLAKNPVYLSRGYGGTLNKPTFVDIHTHNYKQTGDEPFLLAQQAPVIISPQRCAGAALAEKAGHDLILMDDGYQNQSLSKTLQLLVIDGPSGFGNGQRLPAGPLRENIETGIKRADAIILINEDQHNISKRIPAHIPIFKARLDVPDEWHNISRTEHSYVGFTGLGRPEKFRKTLQDKNLNLVDWHSFPDHYPYSTEDLEKLSKIALDKEARLITTAKDAIRIPADFKSAVPLDVMPIHITWENSDGIRKFLTDNISKNG